MKKIVSIVLSLALVTLVFGCKTTEAAVKDSDTVQKVESVSSVKKPEMIDHKNQKWGKTPPDWVLMEREEIEKLDKYKDVYIFKFETEKSKDLEGAQLWVNNFSAPSEIARLISQRIKDNSAAAAAGNKDSVKNYMEQIVQNFSKAQLSGFKKESDYWIQQRYFTPEGKVEGDFYTVVTLYSMPKAILDKLIADSISGVEQPKTEEERQVRNLVNKSLTENF